MTVWQAAILGLVQGVTEFLPISSSGHLVLLQQLWHMSNSGLLFITCLHLGTLVAVVWAFRNEVRWLVTHPNDRMVRMLVLALVPTALIGAVFEELFEDLFSSGVTVGFEFIMTGVVLWWMDTAPSGRKSDAEVTAADALWIGALQGAAILPALSRSGLTIAAGLWRGLDREAAARFSFLLSIPAILGATVVEMDDLFEDPSLWAATPWSAVALGTLAAAVAGYAAVKGTMWLLRTSRMRMFAVYVWAVALFVLADQTLVHRWFPPLW
ncbi:undecaprenyl-diphosphatase 4 [Alicyclobacillus contaminans]|uniref:undecaprenyl-diphosphate phosphatase n=1 Tax=Alicyclobacillus contaminans TaxID=392016 RepID=UPI0003FFBC2E|nr:undecaprenyl-diphosphate phosphatase [Alicyclobacillus contaminans]GMA48709.1 undecaprenyl-diphosphatase 4 [Alicyclobacillus contaminans]